MALIERTHSHAIRRTLREPYILAALARGACGHYRVEARDARGAQHHAGNLRSGGRFSALGFLRRGTDRGWPGLAALTADALRARDPFLLAGCVGAAGGVLAAVVLFADILHLWVDPRLQQT